MFAKHMLRFVWEGQMTLYTRETSDRVDIALGELHPFASATPAPLVRNAQRRQTLATKRTAITTQRG